MTSATLALLKGQAAQAEAAPPTPATIPNTEAISKLKASELNKLYSETNMEIEGWDDMSVPEKKKALSAALNPPADGETVVEKAPDPSPPAVVEVAEAMKADDAKAKAEKKKEKAAAKAVTLAAKDGEIVDPDMIVTTVQEIEKLDDGKSAVRILRHLVETADFNEFKIGGYLAKIQQQNWVGEYPNFKALIEGETGLAYRKAMYLISIYNGLVEANIPWVKVKSVGWTKLKELVGVLTTDNVDKWVKIANGVTVAQLIESIKAELKQTAPAITDQSETAKKTKNVTFKFHEDQHDTVKAAIEKAKKVSGTDADTVAIEHIALDYLSGSTKPGKANKTEKVSELTVHPSQALSLKDQYAAIKKKHGDNLEAAVTEILEPFAELFPDVNLKVEVP